MSYVVRHDVIEELGRQNGKTTREMDKLLKDRKGTEDWIDLAQNTGRWRALVNAVMNLRFPQNAGNFLTSRGPVNF